MLKLVEENASHKPTMEEMYNELVMLRKQVAQRNAQATEPTEVAVDKKAFFASLKEALDFFFPGDEFKYERAYLAGRLANDATFLGRNKQRRKAGIKARVGRARDQDLDGVAQEYGLEIPRVESQAANENLSQVNESLVRCKALQEVSAYYYETASGTKWIEPPQLGQRMTTNGRSQTYDQRDYGSRDIEDPLF